MHKMSNKCRTCFNASTKGLQSLTKMITDDTKQQKSYADLLRIVANINVINDKSSKLPQFICGCCSRKLKAAYAFVQQAQDVNGKLYLMLQQTNGICGSNKQLNCLQEVQIDIESCLEIKMEQDDACDNSNIEENDLFENSFLKKDVQLKTEDSDEDILTANSAKRKDSLLESNFLQNSSDNLSKIDKICDEENIPNILQQNLDTSESNSNYELTCISTSDNEEWRKETKLSSRKTKKLVPKYSKNGKAIKSVKNDDELLPVKCNTCDKVYANSRLLSIHLRGAHVPDNLKVQCLQCDAKFNRRHNMYAHMRAIHKAENIEQQSQPKKEYACQECSRSYKNKYNLMAHVKKHHNPGTKTLVLPKKKLSAEPKKRFLCTLCGLTFESQSHLNIHFRRHTGEKPYKCEFCDRAYHKFYEVQVHRRTHTGEKPYQCNLCEKAFRRSNKLKIHMRTHTNERPYKCTECEKAFKQSKDLNIHRRTHTGERPYMCDVCQSTFTQSNSLRLHQIKQKHLESSTTKATLSGEISYICQQT